MKPKYRIDRIIPGGFRDSLCQLWEGDDLPTFRVARPYLFDDEATAQRVMWRLQAKCNKTMATPHFPALDIEYRVVQHSGKAQFFLPTTGEHVTRRWLAIAIRNARRWELGISRVSIEAGHSFTGYWIKFPSGDSGSSMAIAVRS